MAPGCGLELEPVDDCEMDPCSLASDDAEDLRDVGETDPLRSDEDAEGEEDIGEEFGSNPGCWTPSNQMGSVHLSGVESLSSR